MKSLTIPNNITRAFSKVGFQLKKHSPEILVAVGVVGTVASAVMACRATTKVNAILSDTKQTVDAIHDGMEKGQIQNEEYTKEDGKKDLAIVYVQTGLKFIKLYGPSVALGVASLGCILTSNNILNKRNAALAAAYATVDSGFKEYRNNVIERFGKELDRELKYNIKAQEVEETVVNEDGTEQTVKRVIHVADPKMPSVYARCFDETCPNWTRSAEHNLVFLRHIQNWANDKLRSDGFLFLNDVYAALGFQKNKTGQVVGWIYNEEEPNGDNYIDFDIYDLDDEKKRQFVNGYEKSVWVDFNVDGNIWELMS